MTASRRPRPASRILLLAPLALALAACQGAGTESHQPPAGRPGSAPASAGAPAAPPASPLDDYLGVGRPTDAGGDETAARKSEEAIARCMAGQGFEYVPDPRTYTVGSAAGGATVVSTNDPAFPNLPPDQFAARYGYGISTAPATSSTPGPGDRNERIVHDMSVAERVAYYHALYGRDVALDARGHLTGTITSDAGSCDGRGAAARPGARAELTRQRKIERVRASYRSLLGRVRELQDRELADPRVAAATRTWSACLASAGFPGYDDVSAPAEKVRRRALALLGPGFDTTGADPAALAALRREEVGLAVADHRCRQAWERTLQGVRRDLEARFVRENLTELKSYRSAMAAATR
jgi:hypothetical protein